MKPLSSAEERELRAALEALRNIEAPPFHPLPIEQLITAGSRGRPSPTPVFAVMSSLAILTFGVLIAIPLIKEPSDLRSHGIPTSCIIQSVSGVVSVHQAHPTSKKTKAHAGMFLEEKAKVKTDSGSVAHLRAGEEVSLILSGNSEFEMTQLRRRPEDYSKDLIFTLNEGRVFCQIDKMTGSTALSIVTPEAKFEVWGTKFEIVRSSEDGTYLGVVEGDVFITPKVKTLESFHVLGGFQTQILKGKQVKRPEVIPLSRTYYQPPSSEEKITSDLATTDETEGILNIEHIGASSSTQSIDQMFEDKDVRR